jgi:hypothetical protein
VQAPEEVAMPESDAVDAEVLRLRGSGRTFVGISRELGLDRPSEAQMAFQRAVRRLPDVERAQVREDEKSRLDRLEAKVKADSTRPADLQARQLATIDRLRGLLAEES